MPLTVAEAIALGVEAEQLIEFLTRALRKDEDGKSRLVRSESRELVRRLTSLAEHVIRDAVD